MKKLLLILICLPFIGFGQQSKGYETRPLGISIGNSTKANSIIISDIPVYLWHRGCGPTALGMIVGYYDLHGFDELFPDSTSIQTNDINMLIASDDHYSNYSSPLDYFPDLLADISETGIPHQDNSIADFMKTSMSLYGNFWGWSWSSDIGSAFEDYVSFRSSHYITSTNQEYYSNNSWNNYKTEIDNNRPVIILVDTDGDNSTDHFVVGVGYNDSNQEFACYDTWDSDLHWYSWKKMGFDINWGISSFTKFNIEKIVPYHNEVFISKKLNKVLNLLGKETKPKKNTPLIEIYDDGTIEKRIVIE